MEVGRKEQKGGESGRMGDRLWRGSTLEAFPPEAWLVPASG